jgi:L-fuculose-phosphate aldolase
MAERGKGADAVPVEEKALRRAVVEAARRLGGEGLSPGTSGNVSARFADGMLITPTGMRYETLTDAQIVFMRMEGSTPRGSLSPSSEWHFHRAIYTAKPEAGAVVHCHSPNATALACALKPIPAFHYMVAVAGGSDIPLAPYATFGTPELADAVVMTLRNRRACLLAHHGQIAYGPDVASALGLAREVETLAEQYLKTLQIGGGPILGDAEMAEVLEKFKTYGQQRPAKARKPARSA